ncbi:unnamed protein product [Lupinus luteus]|uniref:Uncharacterized protein n=1 Tax=Lupinus luteus TaxID=3873 RepID=A0AAV1WB00_LUPLU
MNRSSKGYAWALSAGFNAALAAISTKLPFHQIVRYGMVLLFNVTMWASYVNSLKALSSLQATVTNFATNFISSGLVGFFFFHESLSPQGINLQKNHESVRENQFAVCYQNERIVFQ